MKNRINANDLFRAALLRRLKKVWGIFLFISLSSAFYPAGAVSRDALTRFLAGVYLLSNAQDLPEFERNERYRQLEEITGVSAEKAKKALDGYRKDPEQWKRIHEAILEIYEKPSISDTTLNKKEEITHGE